MNRQAARHRESVGERVPHLTRRLEDVVCGKANHRIRAIRLKAFATGVRYELEFTVVFFRDTRRPPQAPNSANWALDPSKIAPESVPHVGAAFFVAFCSTAVIGDTHFSH